MVAMEKWSSEDEIRRRDDIARERAYNAQFAHQMSSAALRQWERALSGMVALPVAVALGTAATASYCLVMLQRGFEAFEAALGEVGRSVASEKRDAVGTVNERRNERAEALA